LRLISKEEKSVDIDGRIDLHRRFLLRFLDHKYKSEMKIKTFIVFTIFSFLLVGCPGKNVPPKNNQSEYSKKSMY
jgi:hypothetical protein